MNSDESWGISPKNLKNITEATWINYPVIFFSYSYLIVQNQFNLILLVFSIVLCVVGNKFIVFAANEISNDIKKKRITKKEINDYSKLTRLLFNPQKRFNEGIAIFLFAGMIFYLSTVIYALSIFSNLIEDVISLYGFATLIVLIFHYASRWEDIKIIARDQFKLRGKFSS